MSTDELRKLKASFAHKRWVATVKKHIPWELSFDEWHRWWIDSGKLPEKGSRRGQFVMGLIEPILGFVAGNLILRESGKNISFRLLGNKHKNHKSGYIQSEKHIQKRSKSLKEYYIKYQIVAKEHRNWCKKEIQAYIRKQKNDSK